MSEAKPCPQCLKSLSDAKARLVQDSCGHKKCRMCLLLDENGCKTCKRADAPPALQLITATGIQAKTDTSASSAFKKARQRKQMRFKSLPDHIAKLSDSPLTLKCNRCSKVLNSRPSIKYHFHCDGTEKPYRCNECNKGCMTKSHLQEHLRSHRGERPFTCHLCPKTFVYKSKLNRHIKLHTGERPYVCGSCKKSFTNKDALINHVRTHTGEKPFSCKTCGASFANTSNYKKHVAIHSKEKTFMCEECGKKFVLKTALVAHRRFHSRERPHSCSSCGKSFHTGKDLKRHQSTHFDGKPYSCSLCNTAFRRKDNLDRHMRNSHPGKSGKAVKNSETTSNQSESGTSVPYKTEEKPNAIRVIKSETGRPANAVPVINGPFRLRRDADMDQTAAEEHFDMEECASICHGIFSPLSISTAKAQPIQPDSIIRKVDSPEIRQGILTPVIISPSHRSSLEFEKPSIIKNIKFKLPSSYTTDVIRASLRDFPNPSYRSSLVDDSDLRPENAKMSVIVSAQSAGEVKTGQTDFADDSQALVEMHWRRRTAQNLHSKKAE